MSDTVKKHDWGYEAEWARTETYGAKMLMFPARNSKTPIFFQKTVNKSWFINNGSFIMGWIDTKNGQVFEQQLDEGKVFNIPAMLPVGLISLTDNSSVTEVNDGYKADDICVVLPGDVIESEQNAA